MEKQPKINNEKLYKRHRESAKEIKEAQKRYDDIIRENQEAGNIELRPKILEEATSLYQEWGKKQIAEAVEKKDFKRVEKIIIGLEERQRTVRKSETRKERFIEKDSEGKPIWSLENEYNNEGKIIKEVKKDLEGNLIESYEYEYDENGNMKKEVRREYSEGKLTGSWENKYNKEGKIEGKIIEQVKRDLEGNIIESLENEYNNEGNRTKEVRREYSEGKLIGSLEIKYDKEGNRIKEVKKDLEGNIIMSREIKYNDKGNRTEEIERDSEGKIIWSSKNPL